MSDFEFYRRRLPHVHWKDSTYFITFRLRKGRLTKQEITLVRDHIVSGSHRFYVLFAAVVMPDHVHLLLRLGPGFTLPRILKGIKGVTARRINQRRGRRGPFWQDESYDRIVRGQKEFKEKLWYMLTNPLKKNLVKDPWEYCGWFMNRVE